MRYALWYLLSLCTFSSVAFNIVGYTVKGCFAQLLGCGAQAHTTRHGMGGRRRQRTYAVRGRQILTLHIWGLGCAVGTCPNHHRCEFSWPLARPRPSRPRPRYPRPCPRAGPWGPCGLAGGVGREMSKCTLLRDTRQSWAKCPDLPQLKHVREDGLLELVTKAGVMRFGRGR